MQEEDCLALLSILEGRLNSSLFFPCLLSPHKRQFDVQLRLITQLIRCSSAVEEGLVQGIITNVLKYFEIMDLHLINVFVESISKALSPEKIKLLIIRCLNENELEFALRIMMFAPNTMLLNRMKLLDCLGQKLSQSDSETPTHMAFLDKLEAVFPEATPALSVSSPPVFQPNSTTYRDYIDLKDDAGNTLLMRALAKSDGGSNQSYHSMFEFLLAAGASLIEFNHDGKSVLDLAKEQSSRYLENLIEARSKKFGKESKDVVLSQTPFPQSVGGLVVNYLSFYTDTKEALPEESAAQSSLAGACGSRD